MEAIDSAKSSFVLIFVDSSQGGYGKLPDAAKSALNSTEAGNYIPKMAVLDPKMEVSFGAIRYEALKEGRSAFRDVKKKAKEFFDAAAKAPAGGTAAKSETATEAWTNSTGQTIQAKFVKLEGSSVSLLLPSGQTVQVPLAKLSAASQQRAQEAGSSQ